MQKDQYGDAVEEMKLLKKKKNLDSGRKGRVGFCVWTTLGVLFFKYLSWGGGGHLKRVWDRTLQCEREDVWLSFFWMVSDMRSIYRWGK